MGARGGSRSWVVLLATALMFAPLDATAGGPRPLTAHAGAELVTAGEWRPPSAGATIEFLKLQPGTLRLCLEEGTQATWLAEILTPHMAQLAVVPVRESRGPKDDERDALAEQMRNGRLETTVYSFRAGVPDDHERGSPFPTSPAVPSLAVSLRGASPARSRRG